MDAQPREMNISDMAEPEQRSKRTVVPFTKYSPSEASVAAPPREKTKLKVTASLITKPAAARAAAASTKTVLSKRCVCVLCIVVVLLISTQSNNRSRFLALCIQLRVDSDDDDDDKGHTFAAFSHASSSAFRQLGLYSLTDLFNPTNSTTVRYFKVLVREKSQPITQDASVTNRRVFIAIGDGGKNAPRQLDWPLERLAEIDKQIMKNHGRTNQLGDALLPATTTNLDCTLEHAKSPDGREEKKSK